MKTFNKVGMSAHMDKQRAELYMDIYKYAAEDFSAVSDSKIYEQKLQQWANQVEQRLVTLSNGLKKHTHPITPHTHPIPPHTHSETPHTHMSGAPGSSTSPQIGSYSTMPGGTPNTVQNQVLQTGVPKNPQALQWRKIVVPSPAINTTGAISNIDQNKIIIAANKDGIPSKLRAKVIPILRKPSIPPNLEIAATI